MPDKAHRQALIRQFVRSRRTGSQEQLRQALRQWGEQVDQSTLSRDLAELGIRKAGGRYVLSNGAERPAGFVDFAAVVTGFTTCGPHLIVVRTATGQAQPVALAIDERQESAIVATLAGDDTIFIATPSRRSQAVALRRLAQWFGEKKE